MRPFPTLALGALALSTLGFAPALDAPAPTQAPTVAAAEQEQIVICVRFRDVQLPVTGTTVEKPARRLCVELPDVNPDMLPVTEDQE